MANNAEEDNEIMNVDSETRIVSIHNLSGKFKSKSSIYAILVDHCKSFSS